MDVAKTDIAGEQDLVLQQAKKEAEERAKDIGGNEMEQEEVRRAIEEEQRQLEAVLEDLARPTREGLEIQQDAEKSYLKTDLEKIDEDEQEEGEILARQAKEREDFERRLKDEEERLVSALEEELGAIDEDDLEEEPLSPEQARDELKQQLQQKRAVVEKRIESLNADDQRDILAALDEEEEEASAQLNAALANGEIPDLGISAEAAAAKKRAQDAAALAAVHRAMLADRLKSKRKKAEAAAKELPEAEQAAALAMIEEEEDAATARLETQIASGKVNLDDIVQGEAASNSARANELKVLANAHRDLLKKRLKAKRKKAEAQVKSLNKAGQGTWRPSTKRSLRPRRCSRRSSAAATRLRSAVGAPRGHRRGGREAARGAGAQPAADAAREKRASHRRRRWPEQLRAELMDTEALPEDVAAELRTLAEEQSRDRPPTRRETRDKALGELSEQLQQRRKAGGAAALLAAAATTTRTSSWSCRARPWRR